MNADRKWLEEWAADNESKHKNYKIATSFYKKWKIECVMDGGRLVYHPYYRVRGEWLGSYRAYYSATGLKNAIDNNRVPKFIVKDTKTLKTNEMRATFGNARKIK